MADSISPDIGTERSYFILRRLHSLLGIIPVGVFLCFHLTINSTILFGPEAFDASVEQIHLLKRMGVLIPVEMIFIFIPLFFHAVLGVVILLGGSINVATYRYGGNVRYFFQRATGLIAFTFVLFHLWQMQWLGKPFGGGFFDVHDAATTAATTFQQAGFFWVIVYVVGILACVFHLANGIWTALITWGITIGPQSQRGAGFVCTALGIVLALVGMGALCGFHTCDVTGGHPAHDEAVAKVVSFAAPSSAAESD